MSKNGLSKRDVLIPVWNKKEPYFEYNDEQKKQIVAIKSNPWRVVPDDKGMSAHKHASTCESLLRVYPGAIEIGSTVGTGETFYLGVFGVILGCLAGAAFLWAGGHMMFAQNSELVDCILGSIVISVGLVFFLVGCFSFRMAAIQPGETLRTSGHGKIPKFPADIIAAAGGSALSGEQVAVLSGKAKT